ncbi:hypothetical protein ACTNBB_09165, partial [Collinsella sp. HCP28S3_B9]
VFRAVLTDNGAEFSDEAAIAALLGEGPGETRLFYCDPRRSDQKGACERNHVLASIYFSPVSLNRRAVRAKAVSPVALTYFHRFRSRLDGAVPRQVLQPVGPAGYLDQVAVVAH